MPIFPRAPAAPAPRSVVSHLFAELDDRLAAPPDAPGPLLARFFAQRSGAEILIAAKA